MSTFVWLDYSERERRKMLDVVDLFREHDTRDELGIGSVRDAFADRLFSAECRTPHQVEVANVLCRFAEMSTVVEVALGKRA